nr:aldo/keto reductase [Candidatus Sigynarchaeota archaeon]
MVTPRDRLALNQGSSIPVIGFGTYCAPPRDRVTDAVKHALDAGYRLIDTAMVYQNEQFVGKALAETDVPRNELFITTKIWKDAMRLNVVRESLEESLENLGLEYVDLLLIHRPLREFNVATWHVLEDLHREGLAKAIGVSNFTIKYLEALRKASKTVPAVNQIEFHPFFYRKELMEYCQARHIVVESYSPLALGQRLDHHRLVEIATSHGKTATQVLVRWHLQHGCVPIPRSLSEPHIRENLDVFDFKLTTAEIAEMD